MSDSYKKHPSVKYGYLGADRKSAKRTANRQTRRMYKYNPEDYSCKGNGYRRLIWGYALVDYKATQTRKQAIDSYYRLCSPESYSSAFDSFEESERLATEFKNQFPTLESYLLYWKKSFLRK